MYYKNLIIGCLLVFLWCNSCKKFVQVDPPADELSTAVIFSNDSLAQSAVTGLYITIMGTNQSLINGGMSIYPAFSADELVRIPFRLSDDQFIKNALTADNVVLLHSFWRIGYAAIYQANSCIQNLSNSSVISVTAKDQLIGEAKFIRSLCFWYLVNLFGDIPLVISTNVDVNRVLPRAPAEQIYQQIVTDLQDAVSLLPFTGPNNRSNKFAANALLARVYCYLNNWSQAEAFASAVINAGHYHLSADLSKVFSKTCPETILQFAPVLSNNSTSEAFSFIPPNNNIIPAYVLSNFILASFEPGDQRKNYWTQSVTINGQTYTYPYKYRIKLSSTDATEYNIVLRLAEQYLIRAEARAHNGRINDAIEDINVIRNRAGLPPVTNDIGLDSCLSIIMQERRKELFTEWGHRWFDLKRTNTIETELKKSKGNDWQSHDRLYPIPLSEMQINTSLVQNDGY